MTLRRKLLVAQLPIAAALVVVSALFFQAAHLLAVDSQSILKDNFRSVLAVQRMKEAIDSLDAIAVQLATGGGSGRLAEAPRLEAGFEVELEAQEHNITEAGEADATRSLRAAWDGYRSAFADLERTPGRARELQRDVLGPALQRVRSSGDRVMALNVDQILGKNDRVRDRISRYESILLLAALAACVLGLSGSGSLTSKVLRPLGILGQTVRRVGEGDLEARLAIEGSDELAALGRDINTMTERLRKYRQSSLGELLEAQQASQAAIDSLADPVIVFSPGGSVMNVNTAAEELFGLSAGTPLEQARAESSVREAWARVRAHVLGGKGSYAPRGFEEAVRVHAPGGERYFVPRGHPVYSAEGAVAGATVVLQDVTRIRVFDELKNDLVATVAHEFRTPLTSLRMAVHLCLEGLAGPVSDKQAELLHGAREDCERLQGIVDDLLDVARLRSGQGGMAKRPVSVAELLESAGSFREEADRRGVALRIEPAPEGLSIDADPDRLALVFANLITNALQHTPAGGFIDVRVKPIAGAVRFEVADTGPGIAPEHRARIFERFFQIPGASAGAAGLGLYISREVVRAHGGEIGVESGPAKGSAFWFTVPVSGSPKRV